MKNLSPWLQKIIDDYKNNLQKFISENNLDADLIKDIEERIFEKVSTLENPNRKNIINILWEIGTPEEIFSEEISEYNNAKNSNNEKRKNFYEKFREKTNKIIFLGTFYELSKLTHIPANFFRIFFLFCIFVSLAANGTIIPIAFFAYFVGFLILRTRFFGFITSFGLWIFFTLLLIPSIMLFGMYLSDFHFDNIYPFMGISVLFPIGMVFGVFAIILFILYFFRYAFTKKFFGIGFLVTAIVSFVVAISMGILVLVDMGMRFSHTEEQKNVAIIEPKLDTTIHIVPQVWESHNFWYQTFNHYTLYYATVEPSETDTIEIHYKTHYRGSREDIQKTKNAIKNTEFIFDNHNNIVHTVNMNTDEKLPLIFVTSEIMVVKVPPFQRFDGFVNNNRYEILEFEGSEKYNFMERMKISLACPTRFYDENNILHCDMTGVDVSKILEQKYNYHLNELKNMKHQCEKMYTENNLEPICDSIDEEMKNIQEICNNGKIYLCRDYFD